MPLTFPKPRHGNSKAFFSCILQMYVVVWSAMRSGSTEFARDLAREMKLRYTGEPFNFPLPGTSRLYAKTNPNEFLRTLSSGAGGGVVMKVFPGHIRSRLPHHCAVVLERRNVYARWCSLMHARRSGDWTGRVRHNCTAKPPPHFVVEHQRWYNRVRDAGHIYITFDDIVYKRQATLRRVATYCWRMFDHG